MGVAQVKNDLNALLESYSNSLYTSGEVVVNAMELLGESNIDEVWNDFPSWLKQKVSTILTNFSESDEVVTFGRADPELVKKKNLFVKHWLQENNHI
ncbi:MAG: hypothetical protein VYA55_03930 [Pseudomonadota bacterium]|nr:hypothetical protein [Pseudomonadota bacterium]